MPANVLLLLDQLNYKELSLMATGRSKKRLWWASVREGLLEQGREGERERGREGEREGDIERENT